MRLDSVETDYMKSLVLLCTIRMDENLMTI